MNKLFFIAFLCLSYNSYSITVNEKIYILADSMTSVSGTKFPYVTFNETENFSQDNPIINVNLNDSLLLWVVNKDNIDHDFLIMGITPSQSTIPVNDSVLISIKLIEAGCFIYCDPTLNPNQLFMGLGGMINVKNHGFNSFYWNIKEHDSSWNVAVRNSNVVDWTTYQPKYFTINGVSNPNINLNPDSRITGNIGDTLYLYISNTGKSTHSLHFHGFHAEIMFSSQFPTHTGRMKDTFPIEQNQTMILRIIPDKSGEYPVHDHNLVAVTGNNLYPNGMFTTILINP